MVDARQKQSLCSALYVDLLRAEQPRSLSECTMEGASRHRLLLRGKGVCNYRLARERDASNVARSHDTHAANNARAGTRTPPRRHRC